MKNNKDERPFRERRRQQFMNEVFYSATDAHLQEGLRRFDQRLALPELDAEDRSLVSASFSDYQYQLLSLRYTAGEPSEPLRAELEKVIAAYERYAKYLRAYENEPHFPVFGFQEIAHFERLAQLIGLSYLLHRRDLIPRIHALIADSGYDGEDAVYEELVTHVLPDRPYLENWYHQKPYLHLLNATDKENPADKTKELIAYCNEWYPAMEKAPWHDGHTRIEGTEGDYFGYWAFEAGAIALLYNIDDSTIDHIVYPKDLVKFAREFKPSEAERAATETPRLRCEANQPCPREGYWHTPAGKNSRRHFKQGELMPDFQSDYGSTIWQWDENQS